MVSVALLCGYLTLCGLFYRGQWQLVLRPSRTTAAPATAGGTAFQEVRFGAGPTGVPQLTGWWIPAAPGSPFAHLTLLYLPSGDGSLTDSQALLAQLHALGLQIFAIDYRGYGRSADLHPSQASMTEDTRSAWEYLTGSRAVPGNRIIPYGSGVGAALALALASRQTSVPAFILDAPDFHVRERVLRDPRSRLLPVNLLLHDSFDLHPALDTTTTPKLILSRGEQEDPAALRAADPKMTVALPPGASTAFAPAVRRFLNQYAPPTPAPQLVMPTPAPAPAKAP